MFCIFLQSDTRDWMKNSSSFAWKSTWQSRTVKNNTETQTAGSSTNNNPEMPHDSGPPRGHHKIFHCLLQQRAKWQPSLCFRISVLDDEANKRQMVAGIASVLRQLTSVTMPHCSAFSHLWNSWKLASGFAFFLSSYFSHTCTHTPQIFEVKALNNIAASAWTHFLSRGRPKARIYTGGLEDLAILTSWCGLCPTFGCGKKCRQEGCDLT